MNLYYILRRIIQTKQTAYQIVYRNDRYDYDYDYDF